MFGALPPKIPLSKVIFAPITLWWGIIIITIHMLFYRYIYLFLYLATYLYRSIQLNYLPNYLQPTYLPFPSYLQPIKNNIIKIRKLKTCKGNEICNFQTLSKRWVKMINFMQSKFLTWKILIAWSFFFCSFPLTTVDFIVKTKALLTWTLHLY